MLCPFLGMPYPLRRMLCPFRTMLRGFFGMSSALLSMLCEFFGTRLALVAHSQPQRGLSDRAARTLTLPPALLANCLRGGGRGGGVACESGAGRVEFSGR